MAQISSGRRRLIRGGIAFLGLAAVSAAAGGTVMTRPDFGGKPEGERLRRMMSSPHWAEGQFQNLDPMAAPPANRSQFEIMSEFLFDRNLGAKSARVHSASSVKAKMLVEFVALIIRQRIYCLLKDEMLKLNVRKNYMTVPAAIKELDKIELVRINQGRYQLDHAITKNQEEILRAFGLTKNHVMARASSISEMIAGSENTSFTEETDDEEEDGDEDLYMTEVYDAED